MFHVLIWCRLGIFNPKFWCDVYYSGIFKYLKISSWEMSHILYNTLHNFSKFRVGVSHMCNINAAQCSIMFTRKGDESHLVLDYKFHLEMLWLGNIYKKLMQYNIYKWIKGK